LPVEYGARVAGLRADPPGYRVSLADRELRARQVVVATGPFQLPRTPELSLDAGVLQLHSSEYRNPEQIPDGPVLVVGGGGYQIAESSAPSAARWLITCAELGVDALQIRRRPKPGLSFTPTRAVGSWRWLRSSLPRSRHRPVDGVQGLRLRRRRR